MVHDHQYLDAIFLEVLATHRKGDKFLDSGSDQLHKCSGSSENTSPRPALHLHIHCITSGTFTQTMHLHQARHWKGVWQLEVWTLVCVTWTCCGSWSYSNGQAVSTYAGGRTDTYPNSLFSKVSKGFYLLVQILYI